MMLFFTLFAGFYMIYKDFIPMIKQKFPLSDIIIIGILIAIGLTLSVLYSLNIKFPSVQMSMEWFFKEILKLSYGKT